MTPKIRHGVAVRLTHMPSIARAQHDAPNGRLVKVMVIWQEQKRKKNDLTSLLDDEWMSLLEGRNECEKRRRIG